MEKAEGEDNGEEREETVEEKIDRLGRETDDLYEQLRRLLSSSSSPSPPLPCTLPPVRVPEPLLKLRRAIKEKHIERELLLEEQRSSKVVEEYLKDNPSILEKVDDCPICLDPMYDWGFFLCCGKTVCESCAEPLLATNETCPLCRERFPSGTYEVMGILREKAAEGKDWAQCLLGQKYHHGMSGLAQDEHKAESLFRSSAAQGNSNAQYYLGVIEKKRDNPSEAFQLYQAAASQGDMAALSALAMYYHQGDVVREDDMEAVRIATVSARLQNANPRANLVLGHYFAFGGGGLDRSMVRSVHYLKRAIGEFDLNPDTTRRYAAALINISSSYYPECATPPSGDNNWPEALFWYRRAIAQLTDAETIPFVESYESKIKEMCAYCYKSLSTDKPKCCTECKAAYYCSRECQAADWKAGHKKDCVKSLKKRLRATGKFNDL
mmetsp:Transcript_6844/g.13358  ORF Transcript_6844/g.13358 Transcript_6844/m.13358 type:complete len:438 (-) Transcript_6844:1230-2543(-)